MPCAYITNLANAIWNDLGQPSDYPVSYIQSKLVSPSYVGKLNNMIATCYTVVTGDITPPLDENEQAVYQLMYETDFYITKMNQVNAGLNPGVISLTEGDSKIQFINPVEQAKVYKEMQRQLNEQLVFLTSAYRQGEAFPRSINYPTILNFWGGGNTNAGPIGLGTPHNYYRS